MQKQKRTTIIVSPIILFAMFIAKRARASRLLLLWFARKISGCAGVKLFSTDYARVGISEVSAWVVPKFDDLDAEVEVDVGKVICAEVGTVAFADGNSLLNLRRRSGKRGKGMRKR
jgi:hypothetical protein